MNLATQEGDTGTIRVGKRSASRQRNVSAPDRGSQNPQSHDSEVAGSEAPPDRVSRSRAGVEVIPAAQLYYNRR